MDSSLIATLAVAITGGSTLGATIAGFFAVRQKTLVTLLREANGDYEKRVKQLEDDRDRFEKQTKDQAARIAQLESEKALPLENLIKLITSQHTATLRAITDLTKAIASNAKPVSNRRRTQK